MKQRDLNKLRLCFCLIFAIGSNCTPGLSLAETAQAETERVNESSTGIEESEEQDTSESSEADAVVSAPPQDGAGLKDRKLSIVFEQFVPSETISADNAVPFPTDI